MATGLAEPTVTRESPIAGVSDYKYGFHDDMKPVFKAKRGLSREVVCQISEMKNEPQWMREFRLKSLDIFWQKPNLTWGGDLSELNFDDMFYYVKPSEKSERSWDDVPADVKKTFDRLDRKSVV